MKSVFGDDELGEAATVLFQSATSKGTDQNYTSNLKTFFEFCDISLIDPKQVSPIDIARYIAWLGKKGTVAAASLQPYLSSINKYLQDHALPPVALGPLVAGVRKGLANCQEDLAPLPQRLPLPAPVALEILELAESLQLSVQFHWSDPDLDLLRAAVATITAYMFFNRGECGACALHGDIVVDNDFVTLLLRDEKGKKALGAGQRNVRQIPCSKAPRFAALLRAFFAGQHSMKGRNGQRSRRWSLGPSEDTALWSADTVSGWLLLACNVVQCHPPEGFSWTSHSLRKGAASAANAIGVRLTDIRYAGGWSTNSTVLEAKYIDFAMLPTPAARLFFGYLCKGPTHEGC
jgi:hypothetical protein